MVGIAVAPGELLNKEANNNFVEDNVTMSRVEARLL